MLATNKKTSTRRYTKDRDERVQARVQAEIKQGVEKISDLTGKTVTNLFLEELKQLATENNVRI